ncbi:hypothetical protein NODU109028_11125 [Nocardioides dubius]|uniref:DUF4064 domain-containing protein n=1 Tax=Nocardioides dubius TaxID=317019 RepID=A0ABP4ED60_9ACTN
MTQDPQQPGQPYGQQPYGEPYPQQQQQWGAPQQQWGETDPNRRPGTVLAAGIVTWICAGIAFAIGGLFGLFGAVARDDLIKELRSDDEFMKAIDDLGITIDNVADGVVWVGFGTALLALLAIITAVFVVRRSSAARILLTVLSGVTVLITAIGFIPLVIGPVVVIVLMYVGGANAWFARRTG